MISRDIHPAHSHCDFFLQVASCFVVFILCILPAHAQQTDSCIAGVFLTQSDFLNDQLSHKINTAAKGYKLSFNFPADLTLTLKIKTPDSTFKFVPGSIYGYSECGHLYRFYAGGKEWNAQEDFYKLEEASDTEGADGLILYSSVFVSGDEIFYSRSLTSSIHRLTFKNLKDDFWDNPHFVDKVEKMKQRLASRDENGFLVMHLYKESISTLNK